MSLQWISLLNSGTDDVFFTQSFFFCLNTKSILLIKLMLILESHVVFILGKDRYFYMKIFYSVMNYIINVHLENYFSIHYFSNAWSEFGGPTLVFAAIKHIWITTANPLDGHYCIVTKIESIVSNNEYNLQLFCYSPFLQYKGRKENTIRIWKITPNLSRSRFNFCLIKHSINGTKVRLHEHIFFLVPLIFLHFFQHQKLIFLTWVNLINSS